MVISMGLDTNGFLLEGIRIATGNNAFTYPPRSIITNGGLFNASPGPAEYVVWISGQSSGTTGIEIADLNLILCWSRNNNTIIRFDWDGYSRKWMTSPGSLPEQIGIFGNSPRLIASIPDSSVSFFESPYSLYIGNPSRLVTFTISVVATSNDFSNPPVGTVEISHETGELNFGSSDLSNTTYIGKIVYSTRQSFFDRKKIKGIIGVLPASSIKPYYIFLNPIPGIGQLPRIRIGYRRYLIAIQVPNESSLGNPTPGTVNFSIDTGRVAFSTVDIDTYANETIYYDGVIINSFSLNRDTVGHINVTWPNSLGSNINLIGLTDPTRFIFFTESTYRYYYNVLIVNSSGISIVPPIGSIMINSDDGSVYINPSDPSVVTGALLTFIDTIHEIENGVSIQLFRSAINGAGKESVPDFIETYSVSSQLIVDGIGLSPMVMLPTIPLVDSSLSYSVNRGSAGGSFVGALVPGSDPTRFGIGYLLDLDSKQLKFSLRKNAIVNLLTDTPSVKLIDSAISPFGFQVTRNNVQIFPDIDFKFDSNTGLVEFLEPIGEDDPNNILGISGIVNGLNSIIFPSGTLPIAASQVNKKLYISSGPNAEIYTISALIGISGLLVTPNFVQLGAVTGDIRTNVEIIVDRVWKSFSPVLKKFKISKGVSELGPFFPLGQTDFSAIASNGQVNLSVPANPGEIFKIEYISLDSPDNGVTITPTPRTEFAGFKIRQEIATYTSNTSIIHFNSSGKTVLLDHPITLYINGVTVPSNQFSFTVPNTITLGIQLTTEDVVLDYYVAECPGGNTTFTLLHSPIDLDLPVITAGSVTTKFNGNQTFLTTGSGILIDDAILVIVATSVYDLVNDITTVAFDPIPVIGTTVNSTMKVCESITGDYLISETSNIDVIAKGSNTLSISGNKSYPSGTAVFIDHDPYIVISSSLDQSLNTKIILASGASRNYVLPTLLKSIRPIYNSTQSVKTLKPAHSSFSMTLFKVNATNKFQLIQGVDYTFTDGGNINLTVAVQYGDKISAFYVARSTQSVGTIFKFNYACQIAPNQTNGLSGQKLTTNYNLYSPDTFFFRTASIVSFIPEVLASLKQNASNSAGPAINDVSSLQTKDYGSSSIYFDQQHLTNIDVVVVRLLKFFNDQANLYEDLFANIDGRVVGGTSGRFRFNEDTSGTHRDSYALVQNDIDDHIKLRDEIVLTNLSPMTFSDIPIYGPMWDYNNMSRFYGTFISRKTVAFNGNNNPSDFGKILGSFGISNLTTIGTFNTSHARAKFNKISASGLILTMVGINGDANNLIPPFSINQHVFIYSADGSTSIPAIILGIVNSNPYQIRIDTPVSFQHGSVVLDTSDSSFPYVHFYQNGNQVSVNQDNGQIFNSLFGLTPPIIAGNEFVDADLTFVDKDTTPKRIPVLDGFELNDYGAVSDPPLTYSNEQDFLNQELNTLSSVGTGEVNAINQMNNCTVAVSNTPPYDSLLILDGPNAGIIITINSIISAVPPSSFTFTPNITIDVIPRNLIITGNKPASISLLQILNAELNILLTNVASVAIPPAFIGILDSEIISAVNAASNLGIHSIDNSIGTITASDVLTDFSVNFATVTPPITNSCFILVSDGPNLGLYKIGSVSTNTLILDPSFPVNVFPSLVLTQYSIISPWQFVTINQASFLSYFIFNTSVFITSTQFWLSNITAAGVSNRFLDLNQRKSIIMNFISLITSILKNSDNIYDYRYIFIQQRIDKINGLVTKINQAIQKQAVVASQIITDQKKLLIMSQLT